MRARGGSGPAWLNGEDEQCGILQSRLGEARVWSGGTGSGQWAARQAMREPLVGWQWRLGEGADRLKLNSNSAAGVARYLHREMRA